jgi:hypothetical protein
MRKTARYFGIKTGDNAGTYNNYRRPYMAKWQKKWTYSGIKAYYPGLSFKAWLDICKRRDHLNKDRWDVIKRVHERLI